MKRRTKVVVAAISAVCILFAACAGLALYLFLRSPLRWMFERPETPKELREARVVAGGGLLSRSEFARVGLSVFGDQREQSGGAQDIAVGELDPHPGLDVVVAGRYGAAVFDRDGVRQSIVRFDFERKEVGPGPLRSTTDESLLGDMRIIDIEGDGVCEYMGRGGIDGAAVFDHSGRRLWSYGSFEKGRTSIDDLAAGDVNGDGVAEFVSVWDKIEMFDRDSAQGFQVESKGPQPAVPQTFTSLEGRFTIALPQQISAFRPVTVETPKGRATLGDSYSWRLPGGQFDVGYLDPVPAYTGDGRGLVNNVAEGTAAEAAKKSGRLVSNGEIALAGGYGREVRIEFPDSVLITRIFFSGGRMFQVLAGVKKDGGAQEAAVRVLDSFRILSSAEVEAARQKQIAEASPSPLSQTPVAARPKSDAQDEGLRGRVKVVFTETEDLSGTWSVQKRKPSAREYYNEQGNLTRRESYDYKGNLDEVTVYGYLDGERASNDKFIRQEYDPPPMLAAPAPGGARPKYDPRYHFKFRFKYDGQGRLAEKDWYSNDGRLWLRYVYSYKGNQKEELVYSEDGSLNQKYLYTLDDKGNEVEEVIYETKDDSVRSKYSYTYEFDAQGNWVKRTTSKWATKGGESHYEPYSVTYRTISYY